MITDEWLAGFCDGESCMMLVRCGGTKTRRGLWQPLFRVNLRDDDGDLLHAIREHVEVGSLFNQPVHPTHARNSNPQRAWQVSGRACAKIVEILDRAPLRSKKRFEYPIWREAVLLYVANRGAHGNAQTKASLAALNARDELMGVLHDRLVEIRKYSGSRTEEAWDAL
jgi:hypothetical protein